MLRGLGITFQVLTSEVDETPLVDEEPAAFVKRMALAKASAVCLIKPESWILAADTIVVSDHEILGKPQNRDHARSILRQLAGREHQVMTAVALQSKASNCCLSLLDISTVIFTSLLDAFIEAYIATGESDDKAGAYAFHGLGLSFIQRIDGCPSTVIGLPLPQVLTLLQEQEIIEVG